MTNSWEVIVKREILKDMENSHNLKILKPVNPFSLVGCKTNGEDGLDIKKLKPNNEDIP